MDNFSCIKSKYFLTNKHFCGLKFSREFNFATYFFADLIFADFADKLLLSAFCGFNFRGFCESMISLSRISKQVNCADLAVVTYRKHVENMEDSTKGK